MYISHYQVYILRYLCIDIYIYMPSSWLFGKKKLKKHQVRNKRSKTKHAFVHREIILQVRHYISRGSQKKKQFLTPDFWNRLGTTACCYGRRLLANPTTNTVIARFESVLIALIESEFYYYFQLDQFFVLCVLFFFPGALSYAYSYMSICYLGVLKASVTSYKSKRKPGLVSGPEEHFETVTISFITWPIFTFNLTKTLLTPV